MKIRVMADHSWTELPEDAAYTDEVFEMSRALWDSTSATERENWVAGAVLVLAERRSKETFQSYEIERHPERFVGRTVTMVGKGRIRWEVTTITAVEGIHLILSRGEQVTQLFDDSPVRTPIGGPNKTLEPGHVAITVTFDFEETPIHGMTARVHVPKEIANDTAALRRWLRENDDWYDILDPDANYSAPDDDSPNLIDNVRIVREEA
ncbi:hypothetical protein [Streptosporangium roseum]|uniref:hypothetical protein n=1 Tax=Streptosporangium roseum TaxID=2001 RepID=UPI00332040B8